MERVDKLRELEIVLKNALDDCETDKVASIAKQYRETLREIEEIENQKGNTDGISEILQQMRTNGLPGSVRKGRS